MAVYNTHVRSRRRFRGSLRLGLPRLIGLGLAALIVGFIPNKLESLGPPSNAITLENKVAPLLQPWEVLAGPFQKYVQEASDQTKISPILITSVMWVETRIRFQISPSGAIGPMQLLPNTAYNQLGVNPWNIRENILGGAKYLRQLIDEFGSVRLALAAYNTGPGTVKEYGVSPQGEKYANSVLRVYAAYSRGQLENNP